MTVFRAIAPAWLMEEAPDTRRVVEGQFSEEKIAKLNADGYNIYYLANYPSIYERGTTVDGSMIDTFEWVFVDFDLKDKAYPSKDAFINALSEFPLLPTRIIDTGNCIHAYWRISDLDVMSYLKLSRRLMRALNTDQAVGGIYQLMRYPGTLNTKEKGNPKPCIDLYGDTLSPNTYTCEQLDAVLPPLTQEDDAHCQQHFQKTYKIASDAVKINTKMPLKFGKLISSNKEAKELWIGQGGDRSKADYRLGHVMYNNGFTVEEATSVLVNSAKAISRAPIHRLAYAMNIIDKIWVAEMEAATGETLSLSYSVQDILATSGSDLKGDRLVCHKYLDDTEHGFRRGHVVGLVAGSGVGKTAFALNMFKGFVQYNPNPNIEHFFVALEQSKEEIAERWKNLCGDNHRLHSKVHIIDNHDENGDFRDLSLEDIKTYILKFKRVTGKDVGCVVIDHIGVLANENKHGQDEGVKKISKEMKAFARQTNTLLVMQSQTSREKAGIGDLELNKDAAFGTSVFENYTDFLLTLWQPLKRLYAEGAPTVSAYKFCKIRHKNQNKDAIHEDSRYALMFDPDTGGLRELTENEKKSFDAFNRQAASLRKQDRKTEIVEYVSMKVEEPESCPENANTQ